MERRKSKILSQFEEIIEEKNVLQENLAKICNQIYSCADHVRNFSDEISQKDVSLMLKYELEIFTKLTEMNLHLESFIEHNLLGQLHLKEKVYKESDSNKNRNHTEIKSEILIPIVPNSVESSTELASQVNNASITDSTFDISEAIPANETEHNFNEKCEKVKISNSNVEESSGDIENNLPSSSSYITELISTNEVEHDIPENIETLKNSFKKFSEKFGLNEYSLLSMKNFYEKPSTSCMRDFFDNPGFTASAVQSETSNFETTSTNKKFEIPEKDTNASVEIDQSLLENHDDKGSSQMDYYNYPQLEEGSTSTESEQLNTKVIESISCEELTITSVNINSSPNVKVSESNDDNEAGNVVYTALEKLNNTKFLNRQEVFKKIKPFEIPDITLKPSKADSSSLIKNDLVSNVENNVIKKNKKTKNVKEEGIHYEIKAKPVPQVGTYCAFSHIESPSEFYIHLVEDDCELIDTLSVQISQYLKDSVFEYSSKEEAFGAIGRYCFGFITGYNEWYRVEVLNWYLNVDRKTDDILVQLVDFGNKRIIPYINLRKLNKDMADIPVMAIRCHLPLMYPPESTSFNRLTEWPPASIDAIVHLSGLFQIEETQNKYFEIVFIQDEGDSMAIDLLNSQEHNEETTVGQILLDLNLAVQIFDDQDENNAELETYLQDTDYLERADNINEAVLGYDPRDEARICRFTKKDGTCFKGKNCKLEHVPLSADGFTTDTEPVFKEAMYDILLPSNGEVVTLLITGYIDTCNFFAQIVRVPHKEPKYVIDRDLYHLLKDMNLSKTVTKYESFKVLPAVGEIVVVKHWSKKWLRAVVRDLVMDGNDHNSAQVFTLDFGDNLKVSINDIRKIKPNFLQLPFQAVECYIHNYKAKKNCNLTEAKEFFQQNFYFRNFLADVMSSTLPLKVGVNSFGGTDIGKVLEGKGLAEKRMYDVHPIDDCLIELY